MLAKLAIVLALVLPCGEKPLPPTPTPDDTGRCFQACRHMTDLGCEGWEGSAGEDDMQGTADDVSCQDFCVYREVLARTEQSPALGLHPRCVAIAASCSEADACLSSD